MSHYIILAASPGTICVFCSYYLPLGLYIKPILQLEEVPKSSDRLKKPHKNPQNISKKHVKAYSRKRWSQFLQPQTGII